MANCVPQTSLWAIALNWMENIYGKRLSEDKKGTLSILLHHLDVFIDEVASILRENFVPLDMRTIEQTGLQPLIIPNKLFPLFGCSYVLQSEANANLKSMIHSQSSTVKLESPQHVSTQPPAPPRHPNNPSDQHFIFQEYETGSFTCVKCSSVHESYGYLVNHLQTSCFMSQPVTNRAQCTSIADRTCKVCCKTFSSLNYLQFYHSKKCSSPPEHSPHMATLLKCSVCNKDYNSLIEFYTHFQTCGTTNFDKLSPRDLKEISCSKCGFIANSKEEFQTMDHNCEPNKRYTCSKCDFRTYHPSSLRNHDLAIHHKDDPMYRCNVCGASYSYKTGFNRHLKTHLEKPSKIPCPHCNKYFSGRSSLNRHMKSHHKSIQQHPCNICGETYMNLRYLKRHMKSVHPESNHFDRHECTMCQSVFREKAYLKKHIRKQHSDT
eukprot:TRINITY_DN7398_c0_g1_i1.p1 TRINITY_DN7398_c0_g1~~TRINITY_DN7398_c0_g1_i1.p1  ORF type:complete len:435 (+),score=108.95 TRINITY_DN7398_c0_g1_i1:114-1418(+)